MKIGTDLEKLQKKIEKEKQYKRELYNDRSSGCLFIDAKKEKPKENSAREKLNFLMRLSNMVKEGATGSDLAYEVEKNQEVKSLIYDGVLFIIRFWK